MTFFTVEPRLMLRAEVKKMGENYGLFCAVQHGRRTAFLQSTCLRRFSSLSLELPQVGVVEIKVLTPWCRLPEEESERLSAQHLRGVTIR